ncbi:putative 3-demethylubiquinone-9 3-methyltransferase (glyoxalase superfamily) [Natranaerovirga pectinivora]|uniref:Putative 3-demethylubiquinone-9 3-methyltransferase (Glyoxalase superfamily) n=1 Tax=Natranaerovirga pectinivora TaxID=682400 RepID=A0A4R3MMU5_9FIRM|nr:VOC family protein [Natranaerovirga pectinivora]TCT15585.1 putative 3-demethylubiquinone-9 3-methyltransferase (glyoxalase superfamily) [Natranaerovirga pectinivora]
MSKSKVMPFLMFQGNAEEAMNYYTSLVAESKIINIARYGPNELGRENSVKQGVFSLKGQEFMCVDSNGQQEIFKPSFSLYLECESEEEIDRLYDQLIIGGEIIMPLGNYNSSKMFTWVIDKFGISWQLNLQNDIYNIV